MRNTDLAWLAGLLEGEGSFHVSVWCKDRATVRVSVKMTDHDVVARAAALMGATNVRATKTKDGNKQAWEAQVSGRRAGPLMRSLLPYMGQRRSAKIKELLVIPGTHNE